MSLNNRQKLVEIAKVVCRDLRKRSTNAEQILWESLRNKEVEEDINLVLKKIAEEL